MKGMASKFEVTMMRIEVIGIARSAPGVSQNAPQTDRATRTTKGLMLSCRPIKRGSGTLPTQVCAATSSASRISVACSEANCPSDRITGNATPSYEPK